MPSTAVRVERHDSPLGRWELVSRAAPAPLRPHVLGYQGYRQESREPFRRTEMPSGEVHVILSFGPAVRAPERRTSFVAAPHTEHVVVEDDGEQHGVELRLTPLGAHRLLAVPMHELANQTVPVADVAGRWGEELVERLRDAADWTARFALLDALLAGRLDAAPRLAPEVEHAWWRLGGADRLSVAALAGEVGWSPRRLQHCFREQAGLPPKAFARILRFQRAARLLQRPDGPSLCEIALGCGYYDQAHLNRDFRAFAGCTPSELLARRLPDGGGYGVT
jgi:AraC-like DNA-binding protein